jgi:hypothetical protein
MSLAPNALATVAEVQSVTGTSVSTGRIEMAINAVSASFENYLGRQLRRQTVVAEQHYGAGDFLKLGAAPIESVSAVTINGTAYTGFLRSTRWDKTGLLKHDTAWPGTFLRADHITDDPHTRYPQYTIAVSYVGGYVLPNDTPVASPAQELPWDIRLAAVAEAAATASSLPANAFGNAGGDLVEESTPGGWKRKWAAPKSKGKGLASRFSDATIAVLNSYGPRNWA